MQYDQYSRETLEIEDTTGTLAAWFESRHTCPKYRVHCTCEKDPSKDTLLDWWSITHVLWGGVYSIPLFLWDNDGWSFFFMLVAAILYEIAENTDWGQRIATSMCCTKDYKGDHFWNSVTDVICCSFGFLIVYIIRLYVVRTLDTDHKN